ncbi:MAG: hypothetical protein JXQ75_17130 [Phycisphaerae bacterium]|nr:hypothetical protein [Phycisphaerae bacterium]
MKACHYTFLAVVATAILALSPPSLIAQESNWLSYSNPQNEPDGGATAGDQLVEETTTIEEETPASEGSEYEKPLPLSLSLDYTLVSDYIFRGFNFSEHATEGREALNHQMGVSLGLDLAPLWGGKPGQCGELGFSTWFEWYADQDKISGDGANIQEIDYTISYGYSVEPIATDITIGWIEYVFPNWEGPGDRTHEWFLSFEHNDAWAWRWLGYKGEDGILNPTFSFYHDLEAFGGTWMDFGISHGFELVEHLTFTPSYTLHIDGGWAGPAAGLVDDHDTRIAGMNYGLDLTYDLTELLRMPKWAGSMSISGFINWSDPTQRLRSTLGQEDQFYGGMKLAWSW